MKLDTLIVCYTRSGTTGLAAKQLARMTGWPIAWVRDVRERMGVLGYLRCTIEGLLGRGAPYVYRGPQPGRYGHVILMSPVWSGGMASPLRRFIHDCDSSPVRADHLPPAVSCVHLMDMWGAYRAAEQTARLLGRPLLQAIALSQQQIIVGTSRDKLLPLIRVPREPSPEPTTPEPVFDEEPAQRYFPG